LRLKGGGGLQMTTGSNASLEQFNKCSKQCSGGRQWSGRLMSDRWRGAATMTSTHLSQNHQEKTSSDRPPLATSGPLWLSSVTPSGPFNHLYHVATCLRIQLVPLLLLLLLPHSILTSPLKRQIALLRMSHWTCRKRVSIPFFFWRDVRRAKGSSDPGPGWGGFMSHSPAV